MVAIDRSILAVSDCAAAARINQENRVCVYVCKKYPARHELSTLVCGFSCGV